jgi:hypothetical protein
MPNYNSAKLRLKIPQNILTSLWHDPYWLVPRQNFYLWTDFFAKSSKSRILNFYFNHIRPKIKKEQKIPTVSVIMSNPIACKYDPFYPQEHLYNKNGRRHGKGYVLWLLMASHIFFSGDSACFSGGDTTVPSGGPFTNCCLVERVALTLMSIIIPS